MTAHIPSPDAELPGDIREETSGPVRFALIASLGGLLFGYGTAVINGAVSAIEDRFHVDAGVLGFVVASALLGAAVGALLAGRIADRYGRLTAMRFAAVMFLLSGVGSGFATSVEILVVFRIVGGISVGLASVVAPAYIAEIAPARLRGRLGSLQQVAISTGILLAFLVDYVLAALADGSEQDLWFGLEAWRWMFLAMCVPALVYGPLSLTIPESPRYLIAKGKTDEARRFLVDHVGEKGVDQEIDRIRSSLAQQKRQSLRDLKGSALGFLPVMWIGIGLSVFQQFVGINVIFYYSSTLWESVGFDESSSLQITVITSAVSLGATAIAIAFIDRVGRRPLLIIGSAGMAASLTTMAVIFGTAPSVVVDGVTLPQLTGLQGPIALVASNLFVAAFGLSWGPAVWVLLGEVFPNRIRAVALSLAVGVLWAANWLITVTFPSMMDFSLGLSYGFYALCAVLSLVFVMRWVRETKGVELEAMR
ncbi:MFS transporter [Rhodococcus sp. WMMA185]|uniref:sugar porter family MFS transporter n=1 Tax=Rhodococcus sp. WMMA185 TaxID=679318 RepID=UPI000878BC24|nr:sugar porter family MFS transporter [Rhodococcus sp. WMMA185]AOW91627.1 MFS transporter [Rhodococcus sp. WMMA185]